MRLSRVHPGPTEDVDLDAADARARLLDFYAPPPGPWLRANLVASVSGSAAGNDGTSESLTSAVDRKLLGVIRELSDIVLVGAQSVRAENFPIPKRARLAVVTRSGNLDGHTLDAEEGRLFVVCPPKAGPEVRRSLPLARILEVSPSSDTIDPAAILEALRSEGFESIVCEGGPRLIAQFVAAGLLDELCLTTSPVIGGPALPVLGGVSVPTVDAELSQLLIDEQGTTFARWATRRATT